jgi:hypothetical protein
MKKLVILASAFLFLTNFTVPLDKVSFNDGKTKREKINCLIDLFTANGDFVLGSELSKLFKKPTDDRKVIQYFVGQNIEMVTYYDGKFWFKMKDQKDQYLTLFPEVKGVKMKLPILIKHDACLEFVKSEKETTIKISGIEIFGFSLEKIVITDSSLTLYKYGEVVYEHK